MMKRQLRACSFAFAGLMSVSIARALPVFDHIVIVIEENELPSAILGSPNAPYINSLAAGGASFASFYSVAHPSQPNYLHMYSGANQGITSDQDIPAGTVFSTPNLGANLLAAGKTFTGYFEDLPGVGSTVSISGKYTRRHNPVVDWQSNTPGPNQYGPQLNQPFTSFPIDFTQLPTVSWVIPNVDNDMHDKPVNVGDTWLRNNLSAYAEWAKTNNSLLIVTWDEDNFLGNNRIPTIMYGQGIRPSQPQPTWTHHNLLRTIEDMYGLPHAGTAAKTGPIVGVFEGEPAVAVSSARDTTGGYLGTSDTWIQSTNPAANNGNSTSLQVNGSTAQGLLRFDNIFGSGAGQTPVGARIISAKLFITSSMNSTGTVALHRMLTNWTEASTWNSLVNGVSTDDVEATSTSEFALSPSFANSMSVPAVFDVTESILAWAVDPSLNKGWLLKGTGLGWTALTSESIASVRPLLEITYEISHWNIDADGSWTTQANWISGFPSGAGAKAGFLRNITAPRTITMPSTHTMGSLYFDSDNSYTLSGATLNITGLVGGTTSVDVMAGAHTIAAAVNFNENTPLNIAARSRLAITGPANIASAKTLTKTGPGTVQITGGISGAASSILAIQQGTVEGKHFNGFVTRFSAGGRAVITPDGTFAATSKLTGLEFAGTTGAWQGQFDLTNNALIVQSDSANRQAVLARLADQIGFARNSGPSLWTGEGLTSSFAADSGGLMTLGILLNDNGAGLPLYSTFAGQSVNTNSILVKQTLVGDMDLDGDIDADDYSHIDAGFIQHLTGYWNGDLNYSGRIDADDFFAIDRAFSDPLNQPPGGPIAPAALVPEPAAMGFGLILAAAVSLRFRRV